MNADSILGLLDDLDRRRHPVDERENTSRQRFRVEMERLAEPCSETASTTHVTASAIVVGPRGLLLHRHKRLGIWLQPGGHIDDGEHPADAALRETAEETGIAAEHFAGDAALVHVDAHDGPRGHYHLDLRYLLSAGDESPSPGEGESPEVRWWPWAEAATITEPGLSGIVGALCGNAILRAATVDDTAALAAVLWRSFRWAYDGTAVAFVDDRDGVTEWVQSHLVPDHLRPDTDLTVAEAGGVVVGYVASTPGWIDHLYVDPAFAGRGVGRALLAHAKARQPEGVTLWTFVVNERARRFYERAGFVAVEFGDGSTNQEGQPDVRYSWTPSQS